MRRNLLSALFTTFLLCVGISIPQNTFADETTVKTPEHFIDLDAAPFIPDGWAVEEHQKGGQFVWTPDAVTLYLSDKQKDGYIKGTELREELEVKPVLNANVLDYLRKNPHLIPNEWKGKFVFFWGTVYRGRGGDLSVRFLFWRDGRWFWFYRWLGRDWGGGDPAIVRAH